MTILPHTRTQLTRLRFYWDGFGNIEIGFEISYENPSQVGDTWQFVFEYIETMQLQMSESPHDLLLKTESSDQSDSFPESSDEIALLRVSVDPNPKQEEEKDLKFKLPKKLPRLNFPPTHCSNGFPRPRFILLIISMEQNSFFFFHFHFSIFFLMFLIHLDLA